MGYTARAGLDLRLARHRNHRNSGTAWVRRPRSRCCAYAVPDRQRHPRATWRRCRPCSRTPRAATNESCAWAIWWATARIPTPSCEWARASVAAMIRGNHDQRLLRRRSAGRSIVPSAARLGALDAPASHSRKIWHYLERLPRGPLPYEDFDLVHGSPLDEDEYLITEDDAAPVMRITGSAGHFLRPHPRAGRISAGTPKRCPHCAGANARPSSPIICI